jgi:large conductance mechanosensitive channel
MTSFTPGDIPVGAFLTAAVAFLIIAFVVYFFVVTPYNKLQGRMSRGETDAPPAADIALLTEIRDLLAGRPTGPSVEMGRGEPES